MSGLDFNGDGNHIPEAVIGYALLSSMEQQRFQSQVQLEQLNLLRAHQGLPPLEYQPRRSAVLWLLPWIVGLIVIIYAGFFIANALEDDGPSPATEQEELELLGLS